MRDVLQLTISPEKDTVVSLGGEIVREDRYYSVAWTEGHKGFVNTDHRWASPDTEEVRHFVDSLLAGLRSL